MKLPDRQYFKSMPCFVTVQDRDLRIITANASFRRSSGDFEGRRCYHVCKQRREERKVCPEERTFRRNRSHSSEERVRCPDGRAVDVIVYTEPVLGADGRISAVMEISTDITEIKQLQEQLSESRRRYREPSEEVPCYISIQDVELNIVDASRLHRRDFGSFLGCKRCEVGKHRKEERYPCPVPDEFLDGEIREREEAVTSIGGEAVNVLGGTSPVRDGADARSMWEASISITQIRRLPSQLASIGMLIGSVSHGIKGVLNGGISLVDKGLENGDQDRLKQGWEIVLRNVARVCSMVLGILCRGPRVGIRTLVAGRRHR